LEDFVLFSHGLVYPVIFKGLALHD